MRIQPLAVFLVFASIGSTSRGDWITGSAQWNVTPPTIADAILKDHQEYQKFMVLQSVQNRVFELQQEIVVNQGRKFDSKFEAYGSFIKGGWETGTISDPKLQLRQRVIAKTVGGAPLQAGEIPTLRYSMFVQLFREIQSPAPEIQPAPPELIWESDTIFGDVTGLGTFDIAASFEDSNFSASFAADQFLSLQATFTASFDTSTVSSDALDFTLGTADFAPGLEETLLSFTATTVPEPSAAVFLLAPTVLLRRRSFLSRRDFSKAD